MGVQILRNAIATALSPGWRWACRSVSTVHPAAGMGSFDLEEAGDDLMNEFDREGDAPAGHQGQQGWSHRAAGPGALPPPFRQPEAPLRWPQLMTVNREPLEKLGRFLLRGLRIGASTISIVELLRNDWTGGISAGLAWLVFLQVERRLPPLSPEPED